LRNEIKKAREKNEEKQGHGLWSIIERRSSSLLAARRQRKSEIRRVSAPSTLNLATGSCKRIDTSSATRETTDRRWSVAGSKEEYGVFGSVFPNENEITGCCSDASALIHRSLETEDASKTRLLPFDRPKDHRFEIVFPRNSSCMMNYSLLGTHERIYERSDGYTNPEDVSRR
ncbi:hypothetical protein K0M31_008670, partial [Melipona bicolor]